MLEIKSNAEIHRESLYKCRNPPDGLRYRGVIANKSGKKNRLLGKRSLNVYPILLLVLYFKINSFISFIHLE